MFQSENNLHKIKWNFRQIQAKGIKIKVKKETSGIFIFYLNKNSIFAL